MTEEKQANSGGQRRGKIEQLNAKYGLTDVVAELQKRRRGLDGETSSLRDLADFFNRELLDHRLSTETTGLLDGESDNIYRLLTDETISSGDKTRACGKLENAGIDVNQLEEEFVSREAVRMHLKRQDVQPQEEKTDQVDKEGERIRQLRNKTLAVTKDKLQNLKRTDRISLGEFRVLVDIQVFCETCNTQFGVNELLDDRGCNCSEGTP